MPLPSAFLDHHTATFDWRDRARAAGVHLGASVVVALMAALLVFELWYPYPYRELSSGRELFMLVVGVDVVLGPLITFAIFDRAKPRASLVRDLACVAFLQLVGLSYGIWSVHMARPVHMVFEVDRFRVVHQSDIPVDLENRAPAGVEVAPFGGPTLLAVRPFASEKEKYEATMVALNGISLSARPDLWQPYEAAKARVLAAARPVSELRSRFAARAPEIEAALEKSGHDAAHASYLPVVARKAQAWTVLLDSSTAEVIGYLPLDSF
ncbi:pilus assembly protein [Ramlibacter sp. G-1-2-2]|uniref:Pilus assembly protein n=1 Tax=Ramlibacter agri TaxID=2728837 RepID=A0A848GVS4_9BURK|nr:TfpX/TfpZ family type IV pilin accessory protein [Ramlibacter agri]NML42715.1 pilus assembly protein [Ramlibacter agri]